MDELAVVGGTVAAVVGVDADPDAGPDAADTGAPAAGHVRDEPLMVREESVSRFSRFKSPRSSAAVWYRRSRSFSIDLPMISSSFGGRFGFNVDGASGERFKMASKITAEVFPTNAARPVPISYRT